jgi:hypothetical protein
LPVNPADSQYFRRRFSTCYWLQKRQHLILFFLFSLLDDNDDNGLAPLLIIWAEQYIFSSAPDLGSRLVVTHLQAVQTCPSIIST